MRSTSGGLGDYMDNLRSTSGILMTIGKVGGLPVVSGWLNVKSEVYQLNLYDFSYSRRSTSGIWMTIGKA